MGEIEISGESVELFKILKFMGMAASGGEAKSAIAEGRVAVNGVVETRKRKKIVAGDVVAYRGEDYRVRIKPEHGS